MLEVHVEEAQAVTRGALLGRIETRTLDDARQSAISAVRNAENQLAVARREVERTEQLVKAGALAARDLDLARRPTSRRSRRSWPTRKSRLASAERQLGDAVIRAPIGGIVAKKPVNVGDVVSLGDGALHRHRPVVDAARGLGAVRRPDAAARRRHGRVHRSRLRSDVQRPHRARLRRRPTRRRGRCRFSSPIPNVGGRLVAGLFAEGRVVASPRTGSPCRSTPSTRPRTRRGCCA